MKEIFDKVLHALPVYVSQLIELLSGPKTFLTNLDLAANDSLIDASIFFVVTMALVFVLYALALPEQKDFLLTLSAVVVQGGLSLIAMTGLLFGIWKLLGGAATFRDFFTVSCYVSSIATIIFTVFALLAAGTVRIFFPDLDLKTFKSASNGSFQGAMLYLTLLGIGLLATLVWNFVTWGAYRTINGLTKWRSAIAFIALLIVTPLVLAFQILLGLGATNVPLTQEKKIPTELLGSWSFDNRSKDPLSKEMRSFRFYDHGGYYSIKVSQVSESQCIVLISENSLGTFSLENDTLSLAPTQHRITKDNQCTHTKKSEDAPLEKETFKFKIQTNPSGWTLCLAGRLGERCYQAAKSP